MGARLNRVDPRDFEPKPVVYVDKVRREYAKMPGKRRKIPREVRAQLYQLDLTVRESQAEIKRLLAECGVSVGHVAMARIRKERGR